MAVVKSPKNLKKKTLWIDKHNKSFVKKIKYTFKSFKVKKTFHQKQIGWFKLASKQKMLDENFYLFFS